MSKFNTAVWKDDIAAKAKELQAAEDASKAANIKAAERRASLKVSNSPNIIRDFNSVYTVEHWLLQAGYTQRGNTFRHPSSKDGSFSASVLNGRVHALSTKDKLYSRGEGARDAFDVFMILFHDDDRNAALKDAGDNHLKIDGMSYNQANQIEWAKIKAANKEKFSARNSESDPQSIFPLSKFSLSGQSELMKKQMLDDKFVLKDIAILGQLTAIYAKPNTGKTLLVIWMLIESITNGVVSGENIFYINADDDYKGIVYKTTLSEKYGFKMIAPGFNGFKSSNLENYIYEIIDVDLAHGKILILDTVKKFTDLMNKKSSSEFMKSIREFSAKGGTVILLGHTNKKRDSNGKVVFAGTSDIVDDCDCVFLLDEISKTDTKKQVVFENIKSRGTVANELGFRYSNEKGESYEYRLDSVELIDQDSIEQAKTNEMKAEAKAKNQSAIDAITKALEQGLTLKTEIIDSAHGKSGISKRKLTSVLEEYTGTDQSSGDLWRESVGAKNAKRYYLLLTL